MRVWRGLKSLGCMALRDAAYLLPAGEEREQALRELGEECTREGGVASLIARFIDKGPDFLYVPASDVLAVAERTGAARRIA
jgi:hypothetical protein